MGSSASKALEKGLCDVASKGDTDQVQRLLAAKVDVDRPNWYGITPLRLASIQGHIAPVKLLLAAKADVNRTGKYGVTALSLARDQGHSELAELLKGVQDTAEKAVRDAAAQKAAQDAAAQKAARDAAATQKAARDAAAAEKAAQDAAAQKAGLPTYAEARCHLSAAPAKGTLGPPDAAPAEDETCAPVPPLTMPVKDAASVSGIEESLGENADGAIKGLLAQVGSLEQMLLGEVQTGQLADRVAVLYAYVII